MAISTDHPLQEIDQPDVTVSNAPQSEYVSIEGKLISKGNLNAVTTIHTFSAADTIDLRMGTPSESQLAAIKSYLHSGDSTTAEDWFVFSAIASDNLISRSYRKWHLNMLTQIADGLKGRPFLLDHEWDDAEETVGFIFDSKLVKLSTPIMAAVNQPMKTAMNQAIVSLEGHHMVICSIAASPLKTKSAVTGRTYQSVSTGGLMQAIKMICPNCSATYGREVTFTERDKNGKYTCPHLVPSEWSYGRSQDDDRDVYEDDDFPPPSYADYLILDGVFDGVELSAVVAGNLPYAQIIR
jgi:hypothetical protein